MLQEMLNSDNPLVRYGVAALGVFGTLYFLATTGIIPLNAAWLISVIVLVMVLLRQIGENRASFRP